MTDVLDADLRDFDTAYNTFVARADDTIRAIWDWHKDAKGRSPSTGDLHHIYWRMIEERARWGTLRRALADTWPIVNHSDPLPSTSGVILDSLKGRLIQITQEPGILNRGYSYYSQVWLSDRGVAHCFVGVADERPKFFSVDLTKDPPTIFPHGPLLDYLGTGEGWYYAADGRIYLLNGPRLRRVQPFTGEDQIVFDIGTDPRFAQCDLWQSHSSDDGQTHSATVRRITDSGPYLKLGTIFYRRGAFHLWPPQGELDESQIDATGDFAVIKETRNEQLTNRIFDFERGVETLITKADGSIGHSDCGAGFLVGEDSQNGACVRLDMRTLERRPLFRSWNVGHLSVRGNRVLVSDATDLRLLDLGGNPLAGPVPHGMTGEGYDHQVFANLDPSGRVAAFVSNRTGRNELYLVVL